MTFSFADHVALLDQLLGRRQDVVDRIESALLNVQGKDISRNRDRRFFEQRLTACVFGLPGLPPELSRLKGQLASMHLADGFEPLVLEQFPNELDPLELIVRAYQYWDAHRWPGKSGRLTYAQTIFAVVVLRHLEYLGLRIWDEGTEGAERRLREIQRLLDLVNGPAAPPPFVRDARWLIHTAQGPVTRHLQPYFEVAERIESLPESDRLAIHKAGAKLAGGHLRSQLRYAVWRTNRPLDDPEVLASTRNSNSMDNALLVRSLVLLLEAYNMALAAGDSETRLDLADAILQALSADPELFLGRLDLLAPHVVVEELFVERGPDGPLRHTSLGKTYHTLLQRYGALIGALAKSLSEDAAMFDPGRHQYSPFAIVYGFSADILSNMAAATLVSQPAFGLSLEDTFESRARLEEKLKRARGWQTLPRKEGEREHFEHSDEWSGQVFARLMDGLAARSRHAARLNATDRRDARLFVAAEPPAGEPRDGDQLPTGIESANGFCATSDERRALSGTAVAVPRNRMINDRKEGRFLASAERDGHWVGISKALLTAFTAQGKDSLLTDMPSAVIEILPVTCPGLVTVCSVASVEPANRPLTE